MLVSIAGGTRTCWAADTDAVRGYLGLRVGGPPVFSHAGRDSDSPVTFASDEVFCASTGTGLEYFVMNNVAAVGVELKYLFGSDSTIQLSGRKRDLNIDAFIYTFGLRIFYPEH